MKKLAFLVAATVFAACSFTIIWLELQIQEEMQRRQSLEQMEYTLDQQTLTLQRQLARWYNLNLNSQQQEDFADAYWDILDLSGGAMGYLSIPATGQKQWIYHGTDTAVLEKGVGHIPLTALPTGGWGNHSALVGSYSLEEGDYFYIHILDQVRPYRVVKTEYVPPMELSFGRSSDAELCTLVVQPQAGDRVLLIRGAYDAGAPREEKLHRVKNTGESEGWLTAANMVLSLGVLLIPMCMWARADSEKRAY